MIRERGRPRRVRRGFVSMGFVVLHSMDNGEGV